MQCVRCSENTASKVADAPDGSGAWEVYCCSNCCFSWRSTEEDEVINPEKRDAYFQLNRDDLDNLIVTVPIPPIIK